MSSESAHYEPIGRPAFDEGDYLLDKEKKAIANWHLRRRFATPPGRRRRVVEFD